MLTISALFERLPGVALLVPVHTIQRYENPVELKQSFENLNVNSFDSLKSREHKIYVRP